MIRVDYCKSNPAGAMKSLLRYLPLSLAVREAMRMRALAEYHELKTPVLDVGCGDGLFWEVVTKELMAKELRNDKKPELEGLLGVDINKHELKLASVRLADRGSELRSFDISSEYQVSKLEDLKDKFQTVIANCSLEHVPNLDNALKNIHGFLKKDDGYFYLFVPSPNWTDTFKVKRLLARLGHRAAGVYGGIFDGFFQHHHLYPAYVWKHLLSGSGFKEVEIYGIGSKKANWLFEAWLVPALFSFIVKALVKRYPHFLNPIKIFYIQKEGRFLQEIHDGTTLTKNLNDENIVEYFIRCKA